MSNPVDPEATELHETPPKPFGDKRHEDARDVSDISRIFALAASVAGGDVRKVTGLSIEEIRAIARACTFSALVVHAAAAIFAASDRNAPKRELIALFGDLSERTRPFMGPGT